MPTDRDESYIDYPMLSILGKKPLTSRELQHKLLLSKKTVYKHLHKLEQMGLVVKRVDRRWQPIVKFNIEPLRSSSAEERGTVNPEVAGSSPASAATSLEPPKPEPKPYKPPRIFKDVSEQAQKVAKHFRIPAAISGKEVSMGNGVATCTHCKMRTTPIKYGTIAICPICARDDMRED